MRHLLLILGSLCLLMISVSTGCNCTPDLVPVSDPRPGFQFCRLVDGNRKLLVTVKNQGNADARPSTTTVQFEPGGTVTRPTPATANVSDRQKQIALFYFLF